MGTPNGTVHDEGSQSLVKLDIHLPHLSVYCGPSYVV